MIIDGISLRVATCSLEQESFHYLKEFHPYSKNAKWYKCDIYHPHTSSLLFVLHYSDPKRKGKEKMKFSFGLKQKDKEEIRGEFTISLNQSKNGNVHHVFGTHADRTGYPFTILELEKKGSNKKFQHFPEGLIVFTLHWGENSATFDFEVKRSAKASKTNMYTNEPAIQFLKNKEMKRLPKSSKETNSASSSSKQKIVNQSIDDRESSCKQSLSKQIQRASSSKPCNLETDKDARQYKKAPVLLQFELRQKLSELVRSIEEIQEKKEFLPKTTEMEKKKIKERFKKRKEKMEKEFEKTIMEIKQKYDEQKQEVEEELKTITKSEK